MLVNTLISLVPPTADDFARRQRRMLWLAILGYGAWGLGGIVNRFTDTGRTLPHGINAVVQVAYWIGYAVWIASLLQLFQIGRLARRYRATAQRLDDELFRATRQKVLLIAAGALMACQAFIVLVGAYYEFRADTGAYISIVVAVETAFGAWLYLDRD